MNPEEQPEEARVPTVKAVPIDSDVESKPRQSTDGTSAADSNRKRALNMIVVCVVAVLVLIILLAVVFSKEEEYDDDYVPEFVDYSTGVSLVTFYGVESSIRGRLAQTKITMEIANALSCSSIRSVAIQLPLSTRVAALETVATDTDSQFCRTYGKVQALQDSRDTFLENAAQGLPSAYIEEQEGAIHNLQVALPPLGSTVVELVLEDLLLLRLGDINFELPMSPIDAVDEIKFDLDVTDVNQQPALFKMDLTLQSNEANLGGQLTDLLEETSPESLLLPGNTSADGYHNAEFHLDLPDARHYVLPKILRGSVAPGDTPESGVISTSGNCFEFYFQPSTLDPMPKNVVFVLDSAKAYDNNRQQWFQVAKQAITTFIDESMTAEDTFTIRTFSGTQNEEKVYGPSRATDIEKERVDAFLAGLTVSKTWEDPNFHSGVLRGLLDAKDNARDSGDGTVNALVVLSGHDYYSGENDRRAIVSDIIKLNHQEDSPPIKIFTVGFDQVSDTKLLNTIALLNGGVSTSVQFGDLTQMRSNIEFFFKSEFGKIFLSDVDITFDGTSQPYGITQTSFSMLADGFEVVSRGLLEVEAGDGPQSQEFLKAVTKAATTTGFQEWTAIPPLTSVVDDTESENSYCFQSYAHSRITQLLLVADAADLIGDAWLSEAVILHEPCKVSKETTMADCIRAEALDLALKANVVVKGLTAMATVDEDECQKPDPDADICLDGTYTDARFDDFGGASDEGVSYASSSSSLGLATTWLILLVGCFFLRQE